MAYISNSSKPSISLENKWKKRDKLRNLFIACFPLSLINFIIFFLLLDKTGKNPGIAPLFNVIGWGFLVLAWFLWKKRREIKREERRAKANAEYMKMLYDEGFRFWYKKD